MSLKSFKNESLEEFSRTMKMSTSLEACGVIDERGEFRPFTPDEEAQLGIVAFPLGETIPGVVKKKPYCRPGSKLTIYYGKK